MVTSRDPVDSLAVYSLSIKPISTTIGMITYNTIHECRKGGRGRDNYMDDNNTVHGVGMGEGPEADPGGGAKGAIAPPPPPPPPPFQHLVTLFCVAGPQTV